MRDPCPKLRANSLLKAWFFSRWFHQTIPSAPCKSRTRLGRTSSPRCSVSPSARATHSSSSSQSRHGRAWRSWRTFWRLSTKYDKRNWFLHREPRKITFLHLSRLKATWAAYPLCWLGTNATKTRRTGRSTRRRERRCRWANGLRIPEI